MEYDQAARKRLGRAVRAARTSAGYDNRNDFADKVKRSARQVQALENGESGVGPDTWAAAAETLGWPIERVYALLDGETQPTVAPPELAAVSNEDLAAEVLRRMQAGGEHGGDTAATIDGPPAGPFDEDLDALEPEADAPIPIRGRTTKRAARKDDEK